MKNAQPFAEKVYEVVRNIPRGHTLTYKQVAIKAGSQSAYRAVGNILNKNYDPQIPCHRVVKSNGQTGGYNRGSELKKQKLLPVYDPTREKKVFEAVLAENEGPLSDEAVRRIFECIIAEHRLLEESA